MQDKAQTLPNERRVVITRVFDAPRELVWRAWTESQHMAKWFGPKSFTIPSCEVDPRVGGVLLLTMRGPDGQDYPMKGVFREVVKPERLSFSNIAVDNDGQSPARRSNHRHVRGSRRQNENDVGRPSGWIGAASPANARGHGGGLERELRQVGASTSQAVALGVARGCAFGAPQCSFHEAAGHIVAAERQALA